VDPAYWDAKKKPDAMTVYDKREYVRDSRAYYEEMHDTFSLAGIHALKTKEQAIEAAMMYGVSCYGEIALWGRVAQFELGYRAEVCMIKHLYLITPYVVFNTRNDFRGTDANRNQLKELISSLERRYDCEVTVE